MTVGELRRELEKFSDDAQVSIRTLTYDEADNISRETEVFALEVIKDTRGHHTAVCISEAPVK